MNRIRITNAESLLRQLDQRIIEKNLPAVLDWVRENGLDDIKQIFMDGFGKHDVIQGLLGYFPGDQEKDLQALFGLSDEVAYQAVTEMADMVRQHIVIKIDPLSVSNQYGKTFSKRTFVITVSFDGMEAAIRNIPHGSYEYLYKSTKFTGGQGTQSSNILTVPWINWLFEGATTEAAISFEYDENKYVSRSERAVMVREDNSGWTYNPRGSFVEEILSNDTLQEQMTASLSKEIVKALRSYLNL